MDDTFEKDFEVGVIIARFQTDELTEGHVELIDYVSNKHKKVIIFLGVAKTIPSRNNPLEFATRKLMIEELYTNVNILPIPDQGDDKKWSHEVDSRIGEVYNTSSVVLYGSRDSFIPHYKGKFETRELKPTKLISATATRRDISKEIRASKDFRRGIIYAMNTKFPCGFPVIDVGIINESVTKVLFGKRAHEPKYRFIGGFFDPSTDKNLYDTVKREFKEEGGGELKDITYITNKVMNDWRYRNEVDKILTTLFKATVTTDVHPGDDIAELKWFNIEDAKNISFKEEFIMDVHHELFDFFIKSI